MPDYTDLPHRAVTAFFATAIGAARAPASPTSRRASPCAQAWFSLKERCLDRGEDTEVEKGDDSQDYAAVASGRRGRPPGRQGPVACSTTLSAIQAKSAACHSHLLGTAWREYWENIQIEGNGKLIFLPRCCYCGGTLWSPFEVSSYQGRTGVHLAHRDCREELLAVTRTKQRIRSSMFSKPPTTEIRAAGSPGSSPSAPASPRLRNR